MRGEANCQENKEDIIDSGEKSNDESRENGVEKKYNSHAYNRIMPNRGAKHRTGPIKVLLIFKLVHSNFPPGVAESD